MFFYCLSKRMLLETYLIISLIGIYQASSEIENEINSDCICVPFYLCTNNVITTNGEGIIDIRMKPEECSSYLETCCNKNETTTHERLNNPPKKSGCGYRNKDGVGYKITGDIDNEAQFGEFPWVVAIFHKSENSKKHFYNCVGSLIHPQVVLTAAHCIDKAGSYKIRAGEWDSQTIEEIFKHQNKDVSAKTIHRRYNRNNLQNDVGLLFLDSPVDVAQHINIACLPPQNSIASSDRCFVNGWGRDRFDNSSRYQTILKRIKVPVIPHNQCQSAFRSTRLGSYFRLDQTFMCAGGEEGKDACTGDGGGPLVCPMDNKEERYQQVGIVSWGIGCGTKGIPGAYVNVARYRNWIEEQMKWKNFIISSN